jgi:hypothetical protein
VFVFLPPLIFKPFAFPQKCTDALTLPVIQSPRLSFLAGISRILRLLPPSQIVVDGEHPIRTKITFLQGVGHGQPVLGLENLRHNLLWT